MLKETDLPFCTYKGTLFYLSAVFNLICSEREFALWALCKYGYVTSRNSKHVPRYTICATFFLFLRCFFFSFFAGLLDIPCEVEGITSIITLKRLIGLIHLPVRACPLDGNELILLNMGPTT